MNAPLGLIALRPPRPALARLGDAMLRHRGAIAAMQWTVVAFYAFLVITPVFLPLPDQDARIFNNLTIFAQWMFWGLWWPFVILSMMFGARVWCGVFCPEGKLTEVASRWSLDRPIPRWLKWRGWPFVAFVLTTVYGQLLSVYEYPKPALLILGGSTFAAIAVGLVWGRNKRVWCRYLCPVSGVFGLLARLAPLHFQVDRAAWDAAPAGGFAKVNCAPLVDIRRMNGASACHMCGRCSGHRNAVELAARLPGKEIVEIAPTAEQRWETRLLIFGMLGVAGGAFQWSSSPWFVAAKQSIAEWLVEHEWFALLDNDIPWWLLTHYPGANDVFTWLDGLLILGYIALATLLIGGGAWLLLSLAALCLPGKLALNRQRLAYCLTPLAGMGIFLGLSALTVTLLRPEGIELLWLSQARATLLATTMIAVAALAALQLRRGPAFAGAAWRKPLAWLAVVAAAAPALYGWYQLFFVW